MKININVIGLGFVGLTTALGFSEKKIKTICVEKDLLRLRKIKNGSIPFEEPHLKNILKKNLLRKNLLFSNIPILEESAINVIFICVGTPSNQDGSINLKHVENVIVNLNRSVNNERVLIVIKSTVLPGTISKKLIKLINILLYF